MRLGNYKFDFSEINSKVWIVLGLIVIGIFALFFFWPKSENEPTYLSPAPGFETEVLPTLDPEGSWIDPYVTAYGLGSPQAFDSFQNMTANQGLPVTFKVYIPEDANPDLQANLFGWNFTSGYFVPPDLVITPDTDLASLEDLGDPRIQLGFAQGKEATPGKMYQITGILWWNSGGLKAATENPELGLSPTVLVSDSTLVPDTESQAPTDYIAVLNQIYKQKPYLINLRHVEWASGKQIRICVSVQNLSNVTQNMWSGAEPGGTVIDFGTGTVESGPDPDTLLSSLDARQLTAGQTANGYLVFGTGTDGEAPPGSPSDILNEESPLEIRMPSLSEDNFSSQEAPGFLTEIQEDQFAYISGETVDTKQRTKPSCYPTVD